MRTVYLGTSEFAATVLDRLARSAHRPLLVATPPDRPQGRGRRTQPPPAATLATELGIELVQTANVNEGKALERIRAVEPEAIAVCAFGQLIREPLLSEWPMLNVHPSLLPHWRGAAPIERAIMAGEQRTGVCVMRVSAGLDSGPVALCEEVAIGPEEDFEALSSRLAALGGELLVRALDLLAESRLDFAEQDEEAATYAEKIAPEERRLDPSRPAAELARAVRALTPHVGAYLETSGGERLGVRRARAVDVGVKAGEVRAEWGALLLGCGRGALRLEVVQPAGGKPMAADAYLRGHPLPKPAL
ncbi:MAG TPA: methionyl-tRNA formyltransferase [Solirubrobacterales bacterium]|nr:methionyl-tRNA formyltransferase [Solirubrobacterales bacterium]